MKSKMVVFGVLIPALVALCACSNPSLKASPWDNGYVHIWADISEGDAHTDVPESASCVKADNRTYTLGSGITAIDYYKLTCDGVTGYVEIDQVR